MFAALALAFLVVPFAELLLIIEVGSAIGTLPTVGLLVAVSLLGAVLVKREGVGVWRRARAQVRAGAMPGVELVDGVMILFAGALLLTPGFLTDGLGVALLIPPIRGALRTAAARRIETRVVRVEHIDRLEGW